MGLAADHMTDDNGPQKTSPHESWRQWEPDHEPNPDATAADTSRPPSSLPTLDGLRPHSPASAVPKALAPLNHHNQLTRFIAKQTLGYIPKLLVRSPERTPSPPSAIYGGLGLPRDVGGSGRESPTFRLPSLTPPRSPQKWPASPARFSTDDDMSTATTSDGGRSTLPALRPSSSTNSSSSSSNSTNTSNCSSTSSSSSNGSSNGCNVLHRSSSFSELCLSPIPPLKRQHTQEPPVLHSAMSIADLCQPFRYMRASSCPSDTNLNATATTTTTTTTRSDALLTPPTQRLPSPLGVEPSWRPAIDSQAATACAHGIDALCASRPTSPDDGGSFQRLRLERSSSMDAPTLVRHLKRTAAESIDLTQWLDRPRLSAKETDSADSMHQLEQAGRSMRISDSPRSDAVAASYELKREKKLCAFPQCASNAVTRGLCISHGGGRRCQRKDCTRGAQSKGLCVAHGGGRICRAAGCSNIQRSMGLCIRHGGGRRCSVKGCQKGVVRQDLCTAHGGKRKCRVADCTKHVKKKGLCRSHANSLYATAGSS